MHKHRPEVFNLSVAQKVLCNKKKRSPDYKNMFFQEPEMVPKKPVLASIF